MLHVAPTIDPPRARRWAKNHRRILDAAMEVIATAGFEALSINRLASTLDYTPGALYRYFPSRDALLTELLIEIIESIGAVLGEVATRHRSPLARIAASAFAWRRYADEEPNRFGLVALMLATPQLVIPAETDAARALAAMLVALSPVAGALAQAADDGVLVPGDPRQRTLLTFAGVQGTLLLRKQSVRAPELVDVDQLVTAMVQLLLAGFGADPTLIEAAIREAHAAGKPEVNP